MVNTINHVLRNGNQRPKGEGDVLTCVKVNKGVGSLAVFGGSDSDGTEGAIGCNGVIAFLGGLYARDKLAYKIRPVTMPLGMMERDTPSSAVTGLFQKIVTRTRLIIGAMGSFLNGVSSNPAHQISLVVSTKRSAYRT